ncbi:MAG: deoxyribodipyrimidine photo-lyase, partial [Bacteroidetes bacterium]|nr:deoxyribodipyrimidine photo-lyase [Bacteroidota bacterium]
MTGLKEKPVVNIFWMRRDLRLDDNTALFHALKTRENVLPIFIFDSDILQRIANGTDYRINFIFHTLLEIKNALEKIGSTLYVTYGRPMEVFKSLMERYHICSVYCNRDYEPYANHRDLDVGRFLKINRIEFITYKDQVLFEKEELVKKDGKPYTVFSPYKARFLEKLNQDLVRPNKTSLFFHNFIRMKPLEMPTIDSLGFSKVGINFPPKSL